MDKKTKGQHTIVQQRQAKGPYLGVGLCLKAPNTPPCHFLLGKKTLITGVSLQADQVTHVTSHSFMTHHML